MPTRYRFVMNGAEWSAEVEPAAVRVSRDRGPAFDVGTNPPGTTGVAARAGDRLWVQVEGHVFEVSVGAARVGTARDADALTPPMPATVTRVAVKVGDSVASGDLLIALEAMKMELPIRAPRDGVVRAVHCQPGDLVQPGHVLIEI